MASEGIALRLMHLYRLLAASSDKRARLAIQQEIDLLSARLDQAFSEADLACRSAEFETEAERLRRRHH